MSDMNDEFEQMPAEERQARAEEQGSTQGQHDRGPRDAGADVIGAGAPGTQGQIKDPEDWVTGDQPMTDAQRGYLDSLAKQAGETLPATMSKAEASEQIDRLQAETGRQPQGRQDGPQRDDAGASGDPQGR